MPSFVSVVALAGVLGASSADAVTAAPWDMHWREGAQDCRAHPEPPLEVHSYDAKTFVLRESLCSTFEAPFMYLLVGQTRALLIDTGDVADPQAMPLASMVDRLVLGAAQHSLPLLVVHTHRHLDHRAGDPQFEHRAGVEVVGYDLDHVKQYYGFAHWPDGLAHINLGGRTVDVIPTPGHNETHVAFYDRNTALFFSGDFLLPGRLLIDDAGADLASAERVASFVRDKPVTAVLGGHIERATNGALFLWQSTYHPHERSLAMSKADLLALPAALREFNGFYTDNGQFVMTDSIHILEAMGVGIILVLAGLITGIVLLVRRLRARRSARSAVS